MWCKYVVVALLAGGSGRPLALAFAQPPTLLNLRNQFFLRQLLRAGQPPGSAEELVSASSPRQELGFSFSPAGLLFPYHLGVATMLRDQQVITKSTPIGGSSAGALVAALIGSDLSHDKAMEACFRINAEWGGASAFVRSFGQGQDLKSLVHDVLDDLLPADAHERINGRPGGVRIAVTALELNPRRARLQMMPMFIERFPTREDLIECLLASCMVPFWFTFAPYVSCRGTPAVDGFFSVPPSRFGCPYLPAAKKTVCISPFPASAVRRGVQPPDEAMHTEWLSPEIDPESPLTRSSMRQLLKDALSCSTKEVVQQYFELGRRDALRWLEARAHKVETAARAK